jgi:hypothetical protein
MGFIKLPGVTGKVFVPEDNSLSPRKHACSGCFSCQMCSDDRCKLCLSQKPCSPKNRRRAAVRRRSIQPPSCTDSVECINN